MLKNDEPALDVPMVPARPTIQRIAALRTECFTHVQIARHLQIDPVELKTIGPTVSEDFAELVKVVHDRLMS